MMNDNNINNNINKEVKNKEEEDQKIVENDNVPNMNNENNNEHLETINNKINNKDLKISTKDSNKFDERLLESQNFLPEDILDGGDFKDFNFGDEEIEKKNSQKVEFGENSPIDKKEDNFLMPSTSLGNMIRKESNDDNNFNNGANFDFDDISGNEEHQPAPKQNKESFHFDRNTNNKDNDDWDF